MAYTFSRTRVMGPFRELLSGKNRNFYWDETLDEIFRDSKKEILRLVHEGVKAFEINRPTCLLTDWAKHGIGFVLMQKHCECTSEKLTPECGDGHWKLVFAGSRFTSSVESRYAPIEGEALAVVHGLESARMFVLGCPQLTVAVDHKPLLKFFNDRELETISNPRIFALKEKTLMYSFKIEHIPGKKNCGADAKSRYPYNPAPEGSLKGENIENAAVAYVSDLAEGIQSVTWDRVTNEAKLDEEMVKLVELIHSGFPNKRSDVPVELRQYWKMRDELYTVANVVCVDGRILIPTKLRTETIEGLHAAHQGVRGMMANAKERFFWPGMGAAIRQVRAHCHECNENAPSQPSESLIYTPPPEVPFQQVVTDFCQMAGHDFLIYADRYSGWTEVAKMPSKVFREVRGSMMKWFSTFGVPEEISSDGGPPFNSAEYNSFLRRWDVRKRLSSAHYPQSNGRAEVAVKTAKRILMGNIDPKTGRLDTEKVSRALLTYRNTPLQDVELSPAVMLFGRPLRDHLPNQSRVIRKEWSEIAKAREAAHAKRHVTQAPEQGRVLAPLLPGDSVQIQNQYGNRPGKWWHTGIIAETLPHRQYRIVMDGSRRITLRNRRFLRRIDPVARRQPLYPPEDKPNYSDQSEQGDCTKQWSDTSTQPADLPPSVVTEDLEEQPFVDSPSLLHPLDSGSDTIDTMPSSLPTADGEMHGSRQSTRRRQPPKRLVVDHGASKFYNEK